MIPKSKSESTFGGDIPSTPKISEQHHQEKHLSFAKFSCQKIKEVFSSQRKDPLMEELLGSSEILSFGKKDSLIQIPSRSFPLLPQHERNWHVFMQ